MLFNSYEFIFLFLPVVVIRVFRSSGASDSRRLSLGWLAAASAIFYGLWNPRTSRSFSLRSFSISSWQRHRAGWTKTERGFAQPLLVVGIVANIGFLGYFKYRNFFLRSPNSLFATHFADRAVVAAARDIVHHVSEDRLPHRCLFGPGKEVLACSILWCSSCSFLSSWPGRSCTSTS